MRSTIFDSGHTERVQRRPEDDEVSGPMKSMRLRQIGAVRVSPDGLYPRTPHLPQEPKILQDVMDRMTGWLGEHV